MKKDKYKIAHSINVFIVDKKYQKALLKMSKRILKKEKDLKNNWFHRCID
jgi:hypothetical protein